MATGWALTSWPTPHPMDEIGQPVLEASRCEKKEEKTILGKRRDSDSTPLVSVARGYGSDLLY